MTNEEAVRLLRTEQIGDSENMELAKQMGAKALENLRLRFIMPKCENCGRYIPNVAIKHEGPENENTAMMSRIDPSCCPHCHIEFFCADVYPSEQICILRGCAKGGRRTKTHTLACQNSENHHRRICRKQLKNERKTK